MTTYQYSKRFSACRRGTTLLVTRDTDYSVLQELLRSGVVIDSLEYLSTADYHAYLENAFSNEAISDQSLRDFNEALESELALVSQRIDLLENDETPVIRLFNSLLLDAIKRSASDIHIEPFETTASIRFRKDGVLVEVAAPPVAIAKKLTSRIKVLAKLDIAEQRLPQDGRITVRLGSRDVDLRVSTLPAMHGERVVMRVLQKQNQHLDIDALGLSAIQVKELTQLLAKPNGIVLVTGPTGSGKTTTLYSALRAIASRDRNIMTVEDPIEYDLPGISQTQVSSKTGLTFAKGLRAILRQDPDVVLLGEIRDAETASIAVQASLTGHLVLSTLHTNSAVGAIARMQDLEVEPFLLSSSLRGVLAQRLVRELCPSCKLAYTPDVEELKSLADLGVSNVKSLFKPMGCSECNNSGYSGRQGIYEFVVIDAELRQMIHDDASEIDLEKVVRSKSPSLLTSGAQLVAEGRTTLGEILRVAAD
ncbi:Type II secretion system protein E [Marinobacterium sp. xm-g-59]|uniref:GspE/PulE family protein n=1 Tax=Marinobacterium sp. xm-g-59 TaxID=2497748 RepID=UPI001569A3EE|nr:GspE/PulE family protein [Marinobacterium sp. xm-g-59]NRP96121.1 Type II secretion system protein E [Marinobacterium sp. xm-g-59]